MPSEARPLCWCISKGMAGMNSQTRGLADAVGARHEMHDAKMSWPWSWLPVASVPKRLSVLRDFPDVESCEPPRLVISCGRHGVVPSLALKRRFGSSVFTVHIQDPKMDTTGFDLVVAPSHDDVRGPNVYSTMGAIHYVTEARLDEARRSPTASILKTDERPVVTVLIGGPNRYFSFDDDDVGRLIASLREVVDANAVRLCVLASNRSGPKVMAALREAFGDEHYLWDGDGDNPYFAALAVASYLVVTGDSVSMVTEAAATGRPVYVHHLKQQRASARFTRFHEMFEDARITRALDGELASWHYDIPNDTPRIAALIKERIGFQ